MTCCCATGMTLTGIESNFRCPDQYVHSNLAHTCNNMGTYSEAFQKILCLTIHVELATVGLSEVKGRYIRHILILPFSLFFLKFERNTSDWATLDALHEMCSISGNLVIYQYDSSRIEVQSKELTSVRRLHTLFLSRFEAMIAISSHIRLLVSKSRVSFG